MNRILPYNMEAERAVLGAVLLDESCLPGVAGVLEPDDFYLEKHSIIFKAMCNMHGQSKPIDIVSLVEHIKGQDEFEKAGGASGISILADRIPTAVNVDYWAKIVGDKSERRKGIEILTRSISDFYDENINTDETKTNIINYLQTYRKGNIEPVNFGDVYQQIITEPGGEALDINMPWMDNYFKVFPGDMVIIAGDASQGKSAFVIQIATHLGKKLKTLFISAEMTNKGVVARIIARHSGWAINAVRAGQYSGGVNIDLPELYFTDNALTPTDIESVIYRFKPEVVFIDYLQVLNITERQREKRYQALSNFAKQVRTACRKLGAYNFMVSQVTIEGVRKYHKPAMGDLRESKSLVNDADLIVFIWRPYQYEDGRRDADHTDKQWKEDTAYAIISKNRNGATGQIRMQFNGARQEFREDTGEDTI